MANCHSFTLAHSPAQKTENIYGDVLREDQIRLIKINSVEEGAVSCSLTPPMLASEAPPYAALSWCWGDLPADRVVFVNGSKFLVNQNLFEALIAVNGYLKKGPSTLLHYLWADAICINQDEGDEGMTAEKPGQVRHMDRVYENAASVLVWLGEESDSSDLAMSFIIWLQRYKYSPRSQLRKAWNNVKPDVEMRSLEKSFRSQYGLTRSNLTYLANLSQDTNNASTYCLGFAKYLSQLKTTRRNVIAKDHPLWDSLFSFASRPWFSRVWTFQEIALNREGAIILCGDRFVPWNSCSWVCTMLQAGSWSSLHRHSYNPNMNARSLKTLNNIRPTDFSKSSFDEEVLYMINLLIAVRGMKAHDKRDYVFGIVGLLGERVRSKIRISYRDLQPSDVYTEVMTLLLQTTHLGLKLWQLWDVISRFKGTPSTVQNLPSWCPDFSCGSSSIPSDFPNTNFRLPMALPNGHATKCEDSSVLRVEGLGLDRVQETLSICPSFDYKTLDIEKLDISCFAERNRDWLLLVQDHLSRGAGCNSKRIASWKRWLTNPGKKMGVYEIEDVQKWINLMKDRKNFSDPGLEEKFCCFIMNHAGRHYFSTASGRVGFSPQPLRQGDRICYFPGAEYLHVLSEDSKKYKNWVIVDGLLTFEEMGLQEAIENGKWPDFETFFLE